MSSTTTTTTTLNTTLSGSTSDNSYIPRGDVETKLSFYSPPADGSAPYNWVEKQAEGVPQSNFGVVEKAVTVHDARGHETDFTLDHDAFQFVKATTSPEVDFHSDESIKSKYYPEVEQLLLDNVPGSHKVIIFDHTIRRPGTNREPVNRAHIDQTRKASAERVRIHAAPEEYDTLVKGRYRIINVWRPLNGPLQRHPLAYAAATTVEDDDLIAVEHRYPHRTGETATVKHNPEQKWYFLSGMKNDERVLLKCSDSGEAEGKRVPHTAFTDPRTPEGAPGRESIEVRALVFG